MVRCLIRLRPDHRLSTTHGWTTVASSQMLFFQTLPCPLASNDVTAPYVPHLSFAPRSKMLFTISISVALAPNGLPGSKPAYRQYPRPLGLAMNRLLSK